MTKNRQKSEKSEKGEKGEKISPSPEEAPKKSQKSQNGGSSAAHQGPRSQQQRAGPGCFRTFASALFYVTLAGGVGFAAVHFQRVLEEVRGTSARSAESAQRSAQLSGAVDGVLRQVDSLKSLVEGLESSLSVTRSELEGAVSRMKKGELETQKVDQAVRNLQNDLLSDLSESMKEAKVSQERDLSTLEQSLEQRLADVSRSLKASVAEVSSAQAEVQGQVAGLQVLVSDAESPALLKQELESIVSTVAEIKTSQESEDSLAESLRQQISAVREELQTRNKEVASLSDEVQAMRAMVQEAMGTLRRSLSQAELDLQALKDHRETLESGLEEAVTRSREVEKHAAEAVARALGKSEELETRVKTSEENAEDLTTSVSDLTHKLGALERSVAEQTGVVDGTKVTLEGEMTRLRSQLDELQSGVSAHSALEEQLADLARRLDAQQESGEKELRSVGNRLLELEEKTSTSLEKLQQAISSQQDTQ